MSTTTFADLPQLEGKSGNYTKLPAEGENIKIRILSNPLTGWQYFQVTDDGNRPIRSKEKPTELVNQYEHPQYGKSEPKQFVSFIVYNYTSKKVEICTFTQATLINGLRNLAQDEDWGNPSEYDIAITRPDKTTYQLTAKPKKGLSKEITDKVNEVSNIKLEKLMTNENPFND